MSDTEDNLPPFIKYGEDMAQSINGEGADGEQIVLGEKNGLIYIKRMDFEQATLDRLRKFDDQNLQHDIDAVDGYIYVGDLESIRLELHDQIEKMFAAIVAHRGLEVADEGNNNEESTQTGN